MTEVAINQSAALEDPFWSVQYNAHVYGPFSRKDLLKLILSKQLNAKAQVKRADWSEFRSILDCLEMLSSDPASQKNKPQASERRMAAPRVPVNGVVSVSNDATSISCLGTNISTTGIFIKTGETNFKIGEKVDLTAQISQMTKPFNAKAEIMRFSTNLQFGVGYGMRFLEIDNITVAEISKVVGVRPISEFGEVYSSPVLRTVPK